MKRVAFIMIITLTLGSFAFSQVKEIDAIIRPYVQTNNFSGAVLIAQNGKVVFSKAYGLMNRTYALPNTTQTRFYLASVSMIFTSAAIMKLVEENKVSLDDPLSKYLPGYKYGNIITIHHLLSQRSGIPAIGQNKKVDYDSITKFEHTCEQLIAYFQNDSLLFQPNAKYNHRRSDYILLAYIIEKVTGKAFGAYLKVTIFDPLQMNNTGHSTGEKTIIPNLAAGYAPIGHYDVENADQIDWTSKTGHGSIYSTTEDLNKFANAILHNKILSRESWQKIFTDYGNKVGYAWFISDHLTKKRFQMNGRSPGFASYFAIYPNDSAVVIVLSNNYISLPPGLGRQIASVFFKKPLIDPVPVNTKLTVQQAEKLIGKYKFDETFYTPNFELEITFKDGDISTTWGPLIPVKTKTNEATKFILRSYWSDIEFNLSDNGRAGSMTFDDFKGIKMK